MPGAMLTALPMVWGAYDAPLHPCAPLFLPPVFGSLPSPLPSPSCSPPRLPGLLLKDRCLPLKGSSSRMAELTHAFSRSPQGWGKSGSDHGALLGSPPLLCSLGLPSSDPGESGSTSPKPTCVRSGLLPQWEQGQREVGVKEEMLPPPFLPTPSRPCLSTLSPASLPPRSLPGAGEWEPT